MTDTVKHKIWSKTIRDRANNTCAVCNRKQGVDIKKLDAAHLLSKETYPQYRYDLNNGIALCFRCHKCFYHLDAIAFAIWLMEHKPKQYQWCKKIFAEIQKEKKEDEDDICIR